MQQTYLPANLFTFPASVLHTLVQSKRGPGPQLDTHIFYVSKASQSATIQSE
jgi:hypothetical protein